MFKPAHNAIGCIATTISAVANVVPISPDLYAELMAVLGVSGVDHTYIRVGASPFVEVMRVVQVMPEVNKIEVARAVDGTVAQPHSPGEPIYYAMAAAAVQDMIQDVMAVNVVMTGLAPIIVRKVSTNNFEVSVLPLVLSSDDDSIAITGTYPNISIATDKSAAGCCG